MEKCVSDRQGTNEGMIRRVRFAWRMTNVRLQTPTQKYLILIHFPRKNVVTLKRLNFPYFPFVVGYCLVEFGGCRRWTAAGEV